jgi:protein-tyrosine phosphatase
MPTVYFVCIGNTCRSPMAAAIFNQIALERGIEGVRADSFGIEPFYGDSDDVRQLRESAVCEVMGGVDGLSDHRPKGIEGIAFKEGDRIVLLDCEKAEEFLAGIQSNLSFRGKQFHMLVMETEDPFGGSVEDYVDCCLFLKEGIEERLGVLTGGVRREAENQLKSADLHRDMEMEDVR